MVKIIKKSFFVLASALAISCGAATIELPQHQETPKIVEATTAESLNTQQTNSPWSGKSEDLAIKFVDLLSEDNSHLAYSYFSDKMKEAISQDQLKGIWKTLIKNNGPFKRRLEPTRKKHGEQLLVFVNCKFAQTQLAFKIVVNEKKEISGLWHVPARLPWRPPSYFDQALFSESEVTVGQNPWQLPGTLSMPNGAGPFPAVVLVHGSGPNNRDEGDGTQRVFKDLAWGLATMGIAVLRYDKRTLVHGKKINEEIFTPQAEYVDDALAAVELLNKNNRVNPKQIYVLGHSAGGMMAPEIATKSNKIAGIVIMAGPTRDFETISLAQREYLMSLDGKIDNKERERLESWKKKAALAMSKSLSKATPMADLPYGIAPAYWIYKQNYNQLKTAKKLKCKILILQGKRDYQVTMEDFSGWKKALKKKKST